MKEKRKRIKRDEVISSHITSFKPVIKDKSAIQYQDAKNLLHQGYSTKEVFSKFNLLKAERLALMKEEQILNFVDPFRQVISTERPVKTSVGFIQAINVFKKVSDPIHNEIRGYFSSNSGLRRLAFPDIE